MENKMEHVTYFNRESFYFMQKTITNNNFHNTFITEKIKNGYRLLCNDKKFIKKFWYLYRIEQSKSIQIKETMNKFSIYRRDDNNRFIELVDIPNNSIKLYQKSVKIFNNDACDCLIIKHNKVYVNVLDILNNTCYEFLKIVHSLYTVEDVELKNDFNEFLIDDIEFKRWVIQEEGGDNKKLKQLGIEKSINHKCLNYFSSHYINKCDSNKIIKWLTKNSENKDCCEYMIKQNHYKLILNKFLELNK